MGHDADEGRPPIERAKADYEAELLGIDGVQGVGIGEDAGTAVITVYVDQLSQSVRGRLPAEIGGYPVRIEVSGEFGALPG